MVEQKLKLKGLEFQQLFTPEGLSKLDDAFLEFLYHADELLHGQLLSYRQGDAFAATKISELIIQCAPLLEAFIAELFDIEEAVGRLQAATLSHDPVFAFKKYYVLRLARRSLKKANEFPKFSEIDQWLNQCLQENHLSEDYDRELAVATWGQQLLREPKVNQVDIDKFSKYGRWREEGR